MLNSIVLGKRIANLRKAAGLSQAELAERLSISPQAVSKWERGESMPDAIMLCTLAQGFGVDANAILMPNESELEEVEIAPVEQTQSNQVRKSAIERADELEDSEELEEDDDEDDEIIEEGVFKGGRFRKHIKREGDGISIQLNCVKDEQGETDEDEEVKIYYKKKDGYFDADGNKVTVVPLVAKPLDLDKLGDTIGNTIDGAFKRAAAGIRIFDKKMKIMDNVFNFQTWTDADFAFVNQPKKSFASCALKHSTFTGANFSEGNFNAASMNGCDFKDANLTKASFKSASIKGSDFNSASLADANFVASSLKQSTFDHAVFTGASLRMCSIKEASFTGAVIDDVLFSFSSFANTKFSEGEIKNSVFDQCSLKDVEFENIVFINTALRLCSVRNITFKNCKMDKISYNFFKQLRQVPLDGVELI